MKNAFKIIYTLKVKHSYFANENGSCLCFEPDTTTCQLLHKYNFGFLRQPNGFSVYAPIGKDLKATLSYIEKISGTSCFTFNITTTVADFVWITDMPIVNKMPLLFNSSKINSDKAGVKYLINEEGTNTFPGKMELMFSDLINGNQISDNYSQTLSFKARSTRWDYYIVMQDITAAAELAITGDYPFEFMEASSAKTPDGKEALLISSGKNLLPLSQLPLYRFDLIKRKQQLSGTVKGKVLIKGLPGPHPGFTQLIKSNGEQVLVSPVYVYV